MKPTDPTKSRNPSRNSVPSLAAFFAAAVLLAAPCEAANPIGVNFNGDAQDANGNYGLYPNGLTNLAPGNFVFGQAGWNNVFNTSDGQTTDIYDSVGVLKGTVALSEDAGGGRLPGTRWDGTVGSAFAEPAVGDFEKILYNGLDFNMNHGTITVNLTGPSPSYNMYIYGSGGAITVHDNTHNTDYTTLAGLGSLASPGFSHLTLPATTASTTYIFGDHGNWDDGNPADQSGNSPLISAFQFKPLAPPAAYWTGAAANGLWTSPTNFSTDLPGSLASAGLTATTDVFFNASSVVGAVSTTLGANQSIKTLTISTASAVGILVGNTLKITPTSSATGITVATGAAGAVTHTISSNVELGAAQTWTVADSDRTLVVGGAVSGNFALTKAGNGVLNLNGAQGYDSLTADAGTTNVNGALGTVPANGTATVTVSPGAKLKFGNVSQTLSSLTIGAGATVTFTSGMATGSFSGSGKASSFGGAAVVPEPGAIGLVFAGARGLLGRRRRAV